MTVDIPPEVISYILSYSTNTTDQLVCKSWLYELEYQLSLTLENPNKFIDQLYPNIKLLLPNHQYRRKILISFGKNVRLDLLETYKDFFTKNWFLKRAFKISCINNHQQLIEFFISKGFCNWNCAMKYAAQGGHKHLIDFFIVKGANDWNLGMKYAARGDHKHLVEFFISKGANCWDSGMYSAARGGHKDLVDYFISKDANSWNSGMEGAARGGHKDLVVFFLEKGAHIFRDAFLAAARGGHKHLVDFFLEKGAINWNREMMRESRLRNENTLGLIKSKCPNLLKFAMQNAARGGHKDLVNFFISQYSGQWNWNGPILSASRGGHKDLVEFFISKGAINFFKGIEYAAEGGHKDLVEFFILKGVTNAYGGRSRASSKGHEDLVRFFDSKLYY